jgi:hypothetical protein
MWYYYAIGCASGFLISSKVGHLLYLSIYYRFSGDLENDIIEEDFENYNDL